MANKIINDGRIEIVYPVASGDSEGRNGPFTWHRYDVKVDGVKYACFKDNLAATFKQGVIMSFSYKTEINGEFENHTILEIFKASNWDRDGVLIVEGEDMGDVQGTGAPPTEEAKTVASHSQPAPQPKEHFNGAGWGQAMNQGAIAHPFDVNTQTFDQWMITLLPFAIKWYEHNDGGPNGAGQWLTKHTTPVEPREQTFHQQVAEDIASGPMPNLGAGPAFTPPPESKRGESDFQPVSTALGRFKDDHEEADPWPEVEPIQVTQPVAHTGPVDGLRIVPEPEGNPKLDMLKLWQTQVWQPYSEKTGRSGEELRGLANTVVEWFTDELGKEKFDDAVKFFESKDDGDLDKYLIWLLEQTANYAHMLEQSQPKLIEPTEQQG